MNEYIFFGLGFYIALTTCNPKGFAKADMASLLRGILLGLVFWPIGLIFQIYIAIKLLESNK